MTDRTPETPENSEDGLAKRNPSYTGKICQSTVRMKKKRRLPALLNALEPFQYQPITWMVNRS